MSIIVTVDARTEILARVLWRLMCSWKQSAVRVRRSGMTYEDTVLVIGEVAQYSVSSS